MKFSKLVKFLLLFYVISLVIDLTKFGLNGNIQSIIKISLFFLTVLVLIMSNKKRNFLLFTRNWPFKIYIFISILSLIYTVDYKETILGLFSLFGALAISSLTVSYLNYHTIISIVKKASEIIIFGSLIYAQIYPIMAYSFLQGVNRLSGITYGTHPLACISVLLILINTNIFISKLKISLLKLIGLFFLNIPSLLVLYQTDSRQAQLGLICSMAILIWSYLKSSQRVLVLTGVLLLSISVFSSSALDGFVQSQSRGNSDDLYTLTGRVYIWEKAVDIIEQNAVLGVGFNAGQVVLEANYSTEFGWTTRSAHNSYLQSALDIGLLGALLIVLWIIKVGLKLIKQKSVFFVSVLSYVFVVSFVERGFAGSVTIYSFLLILFTFYIEFKKETSLQTYDL